MAEKHPFGDFIPKNAKFLLLGSFPGRQSAKNHAAADATYDWFYGSSRSQFWSIVESVYGMEFDTKERRQSLFAKLKLAVTDIILECDRSEGNNSDTNLINVVYNVDSITAILRKNQIKRIYFSSKFVESRFKKVFKDVLLRYADMEFVVLPSPSPRFATMSKAQKINEYKQLLPKL